MSNVIFIGTSGYSYSHWAKGVFYPTKISSQKWLEYYSQFFNTVELNITFYRLPSIEAFLKWYEQTPQNFVFAVKGSRFITHIKKLKDIQESLELFFSHLQNLKEKLKVILWQLPPYLKFTPERLTSFCYSLNNIPLSQHINQVFEFRHSSWFCQEVYKILGEYNYSICLAHSKYWPYQEIITANFIYLRLHGGEVLYSTNYSKEELKYWVDKCKLWKKRVKKIYIYFNNDARGYAVKNALYFKKLLNLDSFA